MRLRYLICCILLMPILLLACGGDETTLVEEKPPTGGETQNDIPPPEGMVLIPAGEFLMGSVLEVDPLADELDEMPQHTVFLDAYFIDKYEVSNADYTKFVEATGHRPSTRGWNPKANLGSPPATPRTPPR
jgi:formylglycine-generating enzyme required for sulfatase activity